MPSKLFAAATFTSLFVFAACSDSGGSGSGSGSDAGTDGGSSSTTYGCCIGTDDFSCETEEAAQSCAQQGSPGTCKKSGSCGSGSKPDAGGGSGSGAIGDTCSFDVDCESSICVKKTGASEGVCSKKCDATLDCPSLWTCTSVAGRSGEHCVPEP